MTQTQCVERILSAQLCGDLFKNNPAEARREYHAYAKEIHPDVCDDSRAEKAMEKLSELYRQALDCFKEDIWKMTGVEMIRLKSGKKMCVRFRHADRFELGMRYVCDLSVVYVFDTVAKKYAENAKKRISAIRYNNSKMEKEMKRFMPTIKFYGEAEDGRTVMVLAKTLDVMPLDLVLAKKGDMITDTHAAWIISRLCNLACFLSYNNLSLNGLTPENVFISAEYHSVVLLGGWWYAVPVGEKMIGTTKDVFKNMTMLVKTDKCGHVTTDFESIKAVARKMTEGKAVPDAMMSWINAGSPNEAVELFKRWDAALEKSFGKRKFIKLEIAPDDIYKE